MSEEVTTNSGPVDTSIDTGVIENEELSTDAPGETDAVVDDSEEVEHEGQKYKVPKALKPALMMHADYTRKTQEVAESRKALDAERESFAKQRQMQQEDIQTHARLVAIHDRVQQFEQVNWQQLSEADPAQAQKLWFEYQQLKDARQQLATQAQQRHNARELEAQQSRAKQIEQIQEWVVREIKDWSPALNVELEKFAREDGWSDKDIQNLTLPQFKSIYRAYKADQLLKKQTPTAPKEPPAKPVTQVSSGKGTAKKDPTQMSDAEFAAWRKAQIKSRYK